MSMLKETIAGAVKTYERTSGKNYWSRLLKKISDLSQVRLARPYHFNQHIDRSYSPQRRYPSKYSTFSNMIPQFLNWSLTQEDRLLESLMEKMQRYNMFPDTRNPYPRSASPVRPSTQFTPPRSPVKSLTDVECFCCHRKGQYASAYTLLRSIRST